MPSFLSWTGRKTGAADGPGSVRSLFHNFRRLLEQNTAALELMASMERALGGEYIFDRAFLRKSSRDLGQLVQRTVHCLNGLTDGRHAALYDRCQALRDRIEDLLSGGLGPEAARPVLGFESLGLDLEPMAGTACATLAELRHHFGLPAADGFVLTPAGVGLLEAAGPEGPLPAELARAMEAEAAALFRRRGGACPLLVFPSPSQGEAGGEPVRADRPADLPAALRTVLARIAAARPAGAEPPAVGIREAPEAELAGTVLTLDPAAARRDALSVLAARPGAPGATERHLVRRSHPFRPLRSEIGEKPVDEVLPGGLTSLERTASGLRRGSALLPGTALVSLAESCLAVERVLGTPREIGWSLTRSGRLLLTAVWPLARPEEPEDLAPVLAQAEILARGGATAQAGVAAGRVVHVAEGADPEDFPLGAVAVARVAAPRLSGVLRRAAALVTETGTAVGHLATIAREFRVPALFGLRGALEFLPQGADATVDATGAVVYRGILEPLVRFRALGPELDPSDPEYALLRRLLRHILPLRLIDPASRDFRAENCRSFHDILHFAHEKAVEELAEIQTRHPGLAGAETRRLVLDMPMDIRILDTGGGLDEKAGAEVSPDQVRCAPLTAFLRGLTLPQAWDRRPAALSAGDVLGGLRRTLDLLAAPAASVGRNLAIVSRESLNLSLRLGYHFSVVDAHYSDNPNQNAVYFRFVGGLADERRRERRARLIRAILEGLGFLVETSGDLVVGKFKVAERPDMDTTLARLGELTAFSRQMDTAMTSEADVERLGSAFLGLDGSNGEGGA